VGCCGVVEVNSERLSVNGPASSGVELFMLEVHIKVVKAIAIIILCLVIKLNAFKSGKEHFVVVIKIVILDISLEALVRLIALLT
jgi:hypothetical protein